jgi:hypothetical protein
MARYTWQSREPYEIGEIVELIHSESLVVITDIGSGGEGKGFIVRARPHSDPTLKDPLEVGQRMHPVSPRSGSRLPRYTGELTDEECALVAKAILLNA